jgi:hypothetical protein
MTKFIMETGGKSLISRIYGVFKVKYPGMASIYMMLQKNNVRIQTHNELLCSFDLKGSKHNRRSVHTQRKDKYLSFITSESETAG